MKFEIISYDVWGNTRDGYEVNAAYHTDQYIDIDESTSDRAINRRLGIHGAQWEGELEYSLYGTSKRNGKPLLELRAVTE